jgi:ferritin-like metal-binding protein YciE
MQETHDVYMTGLRNAHAMENQALAIMKPQAKRIESYPEVAERLASHIKETELQITRLEQILDQHGEDHSSVKDMALSAMGGMAAISHAMAPDEILKNSFANFAFENYEIAAYKSLITMAEQVGDVAAVDILQQNLDEEMAMAAWLDEHLADVTLRFTGFKERGMEAKK